VKHVGLEQLQHIQATEGWDQDLLCIHLILPC